METLFLHVRNWRETVAASFRDANEARRFRLQTWFNYVTVINAKNMGKKWRKEIKIAFIIEKRSYPKSRDDEIFAWDWIMLSRHRDKKIVGR